RVGATKMYCNGLMDQENTFLQLLNKVDTYEIRHLQLILFVEGDVAMVLQKVD
ncbi:MAG: META domain-containing protein, partial [Lewinella sp.]|nr:META domain-containing protein [Lewinella sp.]